MSPARWRRTAPPLAAAVALVACVHAGGVAARAAPLTLTPAQRQDAIRFGTRSVMSESFDAEWRVQNAAGETVLVVTPFHRVAIAARHAAFKNEELKPAEIDRVLREQRDRLVVWAHLKGGREDFARGLTPELRVGARVVKPAFVQNERTATPEDGGYRARCYYAFPARELQAAARMSLVVRDADGRETHTFSIDLGAMR